ncbi:hypothetical protein AB0I93_26625 [Streptomyces sp. NPDC049967]|uniref:hypothetical protein n=1 Tax=Streptomyces sp. NPDC049967 TaxID=3155658 RepID=UPI00342A8BAC
MSEAPARQMRRPIDDSAADTGTLVALGLIDPPPVPQYEGLFVEPDIVLTEEPE